MTAQKERSGTETFEGETRTMHLLKPDSGGLLRAEGMKGRQAVHKVTLVVVKVKHKMHPL